MTDDHRADLPTPLVAEPGKEGLKLHADTNGISPDDTIEQPAVDLPPVDPPRAAPSKSSSAGNHTASRSSPPENAQLAEKSQEKAQQDKAPDEEPRKRARVGLRIPDDRVSRPSSGATDASAGALVTPMRIISIDPSPKESPPAPKVEAFHDLTPASVRETPIHEDSWTPYQPTIVDEVERLSTSVPSPDPTTKDLTHFDSDLPAEPPVVDDESIDIDLASTGPRKAATLPPVRPAVPTEPEGLEVRFDDDSEERISARNLSDAPEIAAEDVVSVETSRQVPRPAQRAAVLPAVAPVAASPVIAPAPSNPALGAKPLPAAPNSQRSPLVIVPPHVGMTPTPAEAGQRKKARPWWEELFNDDFLRATPRMTDDDISREADFIEDSLGVAKGGALLDLGCGTGHLAIELTRRGYEVVGLDLSLAMLARAAEEAQDKDQKLNFVQGDMREMNFDEAFDGVFSWNTSFGYFDEEKNSQVIHRVHRALKKGGQFILDVINRDFVAQQAPSLAWFEGDGCVCMDEMQVDWITSRMRIKRTMMMDDGRTREIEYSIRLYALHELGKILHDQGFRVCEVSGRIATPGVFFGNESPRTMILAEKR